MNRFRSHPPPWIDRITKHFTFFSNALIKLSDGTNRVSGQMDPTRLVVTFQNDLIDAVVTREQQNDVQVLTL